MFLKIRNVPSERSPPKDYKDLNSTPLHCLFCVCRLTSRVKSEYRSSKKRARPVSFLWNRRRLAVLNDIKLIQNESRGPP